MQNGYSVLFFPLFEFLLRFFFFHFTSFLFLPLRLEVYTKHRCFLIPFNSHFYLNSLESDSSIIINRMLYVDGMDEPQDFLINLPFHQNPVS